MLPLNRFLSCTVALPALLYAPSFKHRRPKQLGRTLWCRAAGSSVADRVRELRFVERGDGEAFFTNFNEGFAAAQRK